MWIVLLPWPTRSRTEEDRVSSSGSLSLIIGKFLFPLGADDLELELNRSHRAIDLASDFLVRTPLQFQEGHLLLHGIQHRE